MSATARHQSNNKNNARPIMTAALQNPYRPTKPQREPMMILPAPFEPPQTLKRSLAQISPPPPAPPKKIPKTSCLRPSHFCFVELLKTKDGTDGPKTLWWPCLLWKTKETMPIFQDLAACLETNHLKHQHFMALMSDMKNGRLDTRKIDLVGNSKHRTSLVTLLLGDDLPPGYQRSYFDNCAKTTAATGRGRRVFVAGKGGGWQDIMRQQIHHHVPAASEEPSLVRTAIFQCQKLMQRYVDMDPSLELDTSEPDLLALGDAQEEEEEAPISLPPLETTGAPVAASVVPKLSLPPRSQPQATPFHASTRRISDPQKTNHDRSDQNPDTRLPQRKSHDASGATMAPNGRLFRSDKDTPLLPQLKLPENEDSDATMETANTSAEENTVAKSQDRDSATSEGQKGDKETAVADSNGKSAPSPKRLGRKGRGKQTKKPTVTNTTEKKPRSSKANYKDMGCNVDIPRWYEVKKILEASGYEVGTLLQNSNRTVYARPFGDPGIYPNAKLGTDYFIDVASFRAHLCEHGMDFVEVLPSEEEQFRVNQWCRYSIAADYAKPNANVEDFKLRHYQMKQRMGHRLLHNKLGFKFKDKDIYRGYQWPGETKPNQLMEDKDLWIRLAKNGLPKGLPLEELDGKEEVLALLLCIAEHDLHMRPIQLHQRSRPPPKEKDVAENDNVGNKMETDSADTDEMDVDGPNDGKETAFDSQKAVAEDEMELDSSTKDDSATQEQPQSRPSSPAVAQDIIPASQSLTVDSEAIARCHQAPDVVSPRDARQNLVSSFAKAQSIPDVANHEAASNTAVATNGPETVDDSFSSTVEESTPAKVQEANSENQEIPEESTLESWLGSQSAKDVVLPGSTASEKLNACLEALKINHEDELVVGGSLATCLDKIDAFLKRVIDSRGLVPNAYLHVCGGPGVGKTAGINACVKKLKQYWSEQALKSIEKSFLDEPTFLIRNGSEFQNLSMADAMAKTFEKNGKKISLKALQKPADLEDSKKAAIILVLDEVDMLISNQGTEEYLRSVIEHASDESMMLGMIGISNSIENSELNKLGLSGQRVVFGTYSKQDLVDIITSKIGKDVIQENVVEFLASKVSANSGDLRSMLGLVADAVEACQTKFPASKLEEPLTSPIVKMPHAIAVAKKLTTKVKEVINSLPRYERVTLCCGINLSKALKGQDLDFEHFHRLCTFVFGYEMQLTLDVLADILDRLADKDLLFFDKPNWRSPYFQRKIRLDAQSEDVIDALENGLEKEAFFKRMKRRCNEISHSFDRQSRQS